MRTIIVDKRMVGPILFIIFCVVLLTTIISSKPKVLILHSYNSDYVWTQLLDKALSVQLKKRQHIRIKYFYMNSKFTYNRATEISTAKEINQYDPDIIIAFDDNAQILLSKYYLKSDIKIIFAGVNGDVEKYNYPGNKNITGIFERKSVKGIKFTLSQINIHNKTPEKLNLFFLTDSSNSAQQDAQYLSNKDWGKFDFSFKKALTFEQWKKAVLSLPEQDFDYLLVASYRKLLRHETKIDKTLSKYVPYEEVVAWTLEHSPINILALNIFSAKDGFPLAVGSSAYEQVDIAVTIMDELVKDNLRSKGIKYLYPNFYGIAINKPALLYSKYKIPKILESFAGASHNIYH